MSNRISKPVFTSILRDVSELRPRQGSLYITGTSVEERSHHTESWEAACQGVRFAQLVYENMSEMVLSIEGRNRSIRLRSMTSVAKFLETYHYSSIYLDITGLPHRVWAPLLRGIRDRAEAAFCVYVEPGDYQFSATPTETTIFDLSERIEGIAPLPGFASFSSATREDVLFVPLLGFEGARFAFTLENVQPKREDIHPIIGVPGFRPEYPFYTYVGNRLKLLETRAWQNVRFAAANCPFSLYNVLAELSERNQSRRMIVAPIGTKPHALGAILYYLDHSNTTEILYDHPVRKPARTRGTSRVCLYDLSRLPELGQYEPRES